MVVGIPLIIVSNHGNQQGETAMNTCSHPFLKNLSTRTIAMLFGLLLACAALWTTPAHAQTTTTTTTSPTSTTTIAPAPAPIGLTVSGWNMSSGIGQGFTVGGDGKGLVTTLADGAFNLTSESYLTGNSNQNCTADCSKTQATLGILGGQITAARAVNQGLGTQNAPVASVTGTNGAFTASLQTKWVYTPPPAQ